MNAPLKTTEQLKAHYRDVIIPMVAKYNYDHGTDVKPWECVLVNKSKLSKHPDFLYSPENYTFAITILEGKPVFVGDKVYGRNVEKYITVDEYDDNNITADCCTWKAPKKRTFMLNGVELPCPVKYETEHITAIALGYGQPNRFCFASESDRVKWLETHVDLLTEARDKE